MRPVRAAIEFPVQNNSAANARTDRHVDQSRLTFSRAPGGFSQRRSVAVVFHSHADVEFSRQVFYRIAAFPSLKKIHVAEFAGERVDPARRADANAGKFNVGDFRGLSQHANHVRETIGVSASGLGWSFNLGQDGTRVVHHADGNLCSSNVNCTNHGFPPLACLGRRPHWSSTMKEQRRKESQSTPERRDKCSATSCTGMISITNCHSEGIAGS